MEGEKIEGSEPGLNEEISSRIGPKLPSITKAHFEFAQIRTTLELVINIIAVFILLFEGVRTFTPEPALVINTEEQSIPGDFRQMYQFDNPTSSPFEKVRGRWELDNDNAKLVASQNTPSHKLGGHAFVKDFELLDVLGGGKGFRIYLLSAAPFSVKTSEFGANIVHLNSAGTYSLPVENVSASEWGKRVYSGYVFLAAEIICFCIFALGVHQTLSRLGGQRT